MNASPLDKIHSITIPTSADDNSAIQSKLNGKLHAQAMLESDKGACACSQSADVASVMLASSDSPC